MMVYCMPESACLHYECNLNLKIKTITVTDTQNGVLNTVRFKWDGFIELLGWSVSIFGIFKITANLLIISHFLSY